MKAPGNWHVCLFQICAPLHFAIAFPLAAYYLNCTQVPTMDTTKVPLQPLEKIALSCSGGGYRAASFHLGAMSYLNRLQYKGKPLMEHVKLISTVSGGTITGVVYALQKQQGKSFDEFYQFLIHQLRTVDLVKAGIEQLNPGTLWANPGKRKNLINAFAEQYDAAFTQGATFSQLDNMQSHLEAVVYNSTGFDNAVNFRFRSKGAPIFGNNDHRIPWPVASEVKLADAIAASACFPGGFEPIIWPQDFVHDHSPNLKAFAATTTPTGLMDGGIYDNQGIDSILIYKKNDTTPYFDLVIISDVASPYMSPFQPTADKAKTGIRSLTLKEFAQKARSINGWITAGLLILAIVLIGLPALDGYANTLLNGVSLGLGIAVALLLFAKLWLVNRLKKLGESLWQKVVDKIPAFFRPRFAKFNIQELSIRRVEPLLLDRLNSLLILLMSVFLKVVRRLNYNRLYQNDTYLYRRASNLIKELTEEDFGNVSERAAQQATHTPNYRAHTILGGSYADVVGSHIKAVAEEAAAFGTSLWFTEAEQLDNMLNKLLATGQFTMCYNLLEYLELVLFEENNGFSELDQPTRDALTATYEQCKADWLQFKQTPLMMLN